MNKNIFTTSALPYANGYLHIGHILEFIQTDIWVKHKKQNKNEIFYFSGIDSHGTPIMLKSINEKINPEKLITKYYISYIEDLKKFNITYNNFYKTNSYENEILSRKFFLKLYEINIIYIKKIKQFYDNNMHVFLPDRYIIGTCPNCKTNNQHGDICEICNYNYNNKKLIKPISKLSNTKPIKIQTKHYFLSLKNLKNFLNKWCKNNISDPQITNKLKEWLKSKLKSWDISRDAPYFGIKIPAEHNKFFYVWMDAPIGYLASAQNYFLKLNINFINDFFKKNLFNFYHFIGKDIVYFHTLFWPAMLKSIKTSLPKNIFVHGFITINNTKMSKSKNTFIQCKDLIKNVNSDYLRFFFASKINNKINDIDFNENDFIKKINTILIGKFLNILNRISKILQTYYFSMLSNNIDSKKMFNEYKNIYKLIILLYEKRKYAKILKIILKYADKINIYIEKIKPWDLCKKKNTYKKGHNVCTNIINLFLLLLFYIKPIIPEITHKIEKILNIHLNINLFKMPILNKKIHKHIHLANKIQIKN